MKLLHIMALLLGLLFCAQPSAAAETDPLLARMQAAYARTSSFRAEFSQELLQRESGSVEKRQGVLLFQKPLLVRWETKAPSPELFLVTDKEIWDYLPDEALAYRYPRSMAEDSRTLIQVVTGQSALDRDFDVEAAGEEDGCKAFKLSPKEPTTDMTEARILVDPATALLRRAAITDFYGNTNTVILKDMKPDASIAASEFSFTPPAGTEVEDHTDPAHPSQRSLSQ